MKVRKLTADGDYRLGHGAIDFWENTPEAVAQSCMTRLALWRGTWFTDTQDGTPWLQDILGKHDAVDAVLRARIVETAGVLSLDSFESVLDPDARSLSISAVITTIYGQTTLSGVI